MSRHSILILSTDPLGAALLGAAAELAGGEPQFARPTEAVRDALRRIRPAVVLIDCDDDRGCDEAFVGPALMLGARVVLFQSGRSARDARPLADELGLPLLELPADAPRLQEILADSLRAAAK